MSLASIVTGDDAVLPVELKKDEASFVIDSSATIKAAVVSKNKKTVLIPVVDVLESNTGSVWPSSLVVVQFTSAQTSAITRYGEAILEIQVDDGGKITWFAPVQIEQGTID